MFRLVIMNLGLLKTINIILFLFLIYNLYDTIMNSYTLSYAELLWFISLLVVIYYLLTFVFEKELKNYSLIIRLSLILLVSLYTTLFPTINFIIQRMNTVPWVSSAHDGGVIQLELAVEKLLNGTNPYGAYYPELNKWGADNPATYHFNYTPFFIYFFIPFYLIIKPIFGFFDTRIIYLIFYYLIGFIVLKFKASHEVKNIFFILIYLNPIFSQIVSWGMNDVMAYFFFLLCIYFLLKKNYVCSGIFLSFSLGTKHYLWLFIPFYMLFILMKERVIVYSNKKIRLSLYKKRGIKQFFKKNKALLKALLPVLLLLLYLAPFILWNFNALFDDIFNYNLGSAFSSNYMIGGGRALTVGYIIANFLGVDHYAQLSFAPFILMISGSLMSLLLFKQLSSNHLRTVIQYFCILLFVFFFSSRFFNYNYQLFIINLFVISLLIDEAD